jgi:hypothetical protein
VLIVCRMVQPQRRSSSGCTSLSTPSQATSQQKRCPAQGLDAAPACQLHAEKAVRTELQQKLLAASARISQLQRREHLLLKETVQMRSRTEQARV